MEMDRGTTQSQPPLALPPARHKHHDGEPTVQADALCAGQARRKHRMVAYGDGYRMVRTDALCTGPAAAGAVQPSDGGGEPVPLRLRRLRHEWYGHPGSTVPSYKDPKHPI
jgi:hypothetical protein